MAWRPEPRKLIELLQGLDAPTASEEEPLQDGEKWLRKQLSWNTVYVRDRMLTGAKGGRVEGGGMRVIMQGSEEGSSR